VGGCAQEVDGPDGREGSSARQAQRERAREAVQEYSRGGGHLYLSLPGGQENANYWQLVKGGHHQWAIARYCSLDIYEAIREDREQDKRKGKAAKRKAKLADCERVACWRVLRTSDRFSGAANTTEDQSMDPNDSSDEDADSAITSSPSTRNKGYQRRPCGIKAAKLMSSEDAGMEREVKASTAAVDKLTAAQQ